jgi:hypothetical protein
VVVTLFASISQPSALAAQLAADNYTAKDFGLRAMTSGGAYSGDISVSYVAYAIEPGADPATSDDVIIEDTAEGTGQGQVQYSSAWQACIATCARAPDHSYRWTSVAGSTATLRFSGTRISLYAVTEPLSNVATVAIDGAPPTDADCTAW